MKMTMAEQVGAKPPKNKIRTKTPFESNSKFAESNQSDQTSRLRHQSSKGRLIDTGQIYQLLQQPER